MDRLKRALFRSTTSSFSSSLSVGASTSTGALAGDAHCGRKECVDCSDWRSDWGPAQRNLKSQLSRVSGDAGDDELSRRGRFIAAGATAARVRPHPKHPLGAQTGRQLRCTVSGNLNLA